MQLKIDGERDFLPLAQISPLQVGTYDARKRTVTRVFGERRFDVFQLARRLLAIRRPHRPRLATLGMLRDAQVGIGPLSTVHVR